MQGTTKDLTELNKAMSAVKSELGKLKKDAKNPFFKSSYADLNSHLELIEPLLLKNGLFLTQPIITNGQKNLVSTTITEVTTGAEVSSQLVLPDNEDMQKMGSAITYARRYTLGSLFGMQAVDDDGETANGRGNLTSKKQVKSTNSIF